MSNSRKYHRNVQRRHATQRTDSVDWRIAVIVDEDHCVNPDCGHYHPAPSGPPIVKFAYTIGLHQRHRLPELHLPALPAETPSVGEIQMPTREIGAALNILAGRCVDGDAGPGSVISIGGTVRGQRVSHTFTLGEPGPREPLQAFQAHSAATVIPVSWTVNADA
jgi:hypothetical protein